MKQAILKHAILALLVTAPVSGERHRAWTQFGFDELADGRAHGVAITADGTLQPAATLDSFATVDAERIWNLARDSAGTLYAATGDNGRLYAIDAEKDPVFDSPEISLHSLAVDREGTLHEQRAGWHHLRDSPRWPAQRPTLRPLRLGFSLGRAGPSACGYR